MKQIIYILMGLLLIGIALAANATSIATKYLYYFGCEDGLVKEADGTIHCSTIKDETAKPESLIIFRNVILIIITLFIIWRITK